MSGSIQKNITCLIALVAVVASVGCQVAGRHDDQYPAVYPDVKGRHRSIVMDSPVLTRRMNRRGHGTGSVGQPWYTWRNDVVRSTSAGVVGTTFDTSVTVTHDRQVVTGGRARDHYTATTHSYRTRSRIQ